MIKTNSLSLNISKMAQLVGCSCFQLWWDLLATVWGGGKYWLLTKYWTTMSYQCKKWTEVFPLSLSPQKVLLWHKLQIALIKVKERVHHSLLHKGLFCCKLMSVSEGISNGYMSIETGLCINERRSSYLMCFAFSRIRCTTECLSIIFLSKGWHQPAL